MWMNEAKTTPADALAALAETKLSTTGFEMNRAISGTAGKVFGRSIRQWTGVAVWM
ncbi:MAG: hypothetical protein ACREA0_08740 [bacterium]